MKYKFHIVDKASGVKIEDHNLLMSEADLDDGSKFEDIGVQGDGTPVVFNKCGNFGYLSPNKYEVVVVLLQGSS